MGKSVQIKGYVFVNHPRPTPKKEYQIVVDQLIQHYKRTPGLVAIYDWGSPSVPGISDMDLLLVFDQKKAKKLPLKKRSFHFFDKKTKYILVHPFVYIDKESFAYIKYIYPQGNLRLLWGKKLKQKSLTAKQKKQAVAALLNDIVVRHYPRDFLQSINAKSINVRHALLRLHSLKYTIESLEYLTKKKHRAWKKTINTVEKLRKNWFSNPNYKGLLQCYQEAAQISIGIIAEFDTWLKKQPTPLSSHSFTAIKNKTHFQKEWNKTTALSQNLSLHKKSKYTSLPVSLCSNLLSYSREKGPLSTHIRKHVRPNTATSSNSVQKTRARVLNRQAELAQKLHHSDFGAFFDFGWRNAKGINNKALKILDKIKH